MKAVITDSQISLGDDITVLITPYMPSLSIIGGWEILMMEDGQLRIEKFHNSFSSTVYYTHIPTTGAEAVVLEFPDSWKHYFIPFIFLIAIITLLVLFTPVAYAMFLVCSTEPFEVCKDVLHRFYCIFFN